jgi:RNA polymerase sigma-70 factor (ECF subfamily)
MQRIRESEAGALGELMDLYWVDLVHYCTSVTGSPDESEDVAQRVFIQVWQDRAAWADSGTVAGYLFRIARNLSISRARHASVRRKSAPEIVRRWHRPPSPLDAAAFSEFEAALEEAISSLSERRRLAFRLVRFQGLSLEDAGAVMGVSRRTVANHLYLASEQLYERLRAFLT